MKTAIITGITGQDGAYLSKLLIDKTYRIIGLTRSSNSNNLSRLKFLGIEDKVVIEECDLCDLSNILSILMKYNPDEIYNFAAQSSVSESFEQPIGTISFNVLSVLNLLEAIKFTDKKIKFYQSSSSEMFGQSLELPLCETSAFHPVSPYAISKATAHWCTVNYREAYGLFACSGILFNHESPLRGNNFIIRKLVKQAVEISKGQREYIMVGNLDIKRDFGYAPNFIEAIYLMMQQETASDYIICTGKSTSLREIASYILDKLNISHDKIMVDQRNYRPADIMDTYGDATKAAEKLGWKCSLNIFEVLDILIHEEVGNNK